MPQECSWSWTVLETFWGFVFWRRDAGRQCQKTLALGVVWLVARRFVFWLSVGAQDCQKYLAVSVVVLLGGGSFSGAGVVSE